MTPKELEDLERKYKQFLQTHAAKQILKLIEYVRSLENKIEERKK